MLCLPLIHRQKGIGVICAGIEEPQFPLLWEQINLLNLFAGQAAAILGRLAPSEMQSGVVEEVYKAVEDDAIRRVIHEVNNPLGIVKNYLKVLSNKIGEHPGVKDEIGLIREEIDRIPGIIAQLSKSQYKQDTDDEPVDINSILYDLSKLLTRSVLEHANISLNFSPDPRLPKFSGKKSNLIQVFINLLKNSVEAMPAGGYIDISTSFEGHIDGRAGGRIVITIKDDGPGLPEDVRARLFEPGISSKGPEHFGLGLSISKDIISKYNGIMQCESHKDKGTTFRIILPVSG
jgi:signal transduction histidine kinase